MERLQRRGGGEERRQREENGNACVRAAGCGLLRVARCCCVLRALRAHLRKRRLPLPPRHAIRFDRHQEHKEKSDGRGATGLCCTTGLFWPFRRGALCVAVRLERGRPGGAAAAVAGAAVVR